MDAEQIQKAAMRCKQINSIGSSLVEVPSTVHRRGQKYKIEI
jgi:hypothetical protein